MPDNPKPTDTAGAPFHFMARADQPLLVQLACSHCRGEHVLLAAVVPGFHYPCPSCEKKVESGLVIICANCGKPSCAPCVHAAFLKTRAAQLTAD